MFCPSCGARNPNGSRFCKACGTDLSGKRVGAPALRAAAQAPAPGAPAFARPAAAARGRSTGRRRVIAGIAAAVAVALVVAVGLRTSWFGLATSCLVPGAYAFVGNSDAASGSWARQDDGSFVLSFPDSDGALTFQYRR